MDTDRRPEKCYGVEVSSGLTWLPPEYREMLPLHDLRFIKWSLSNYPTENVKTDYPVGIEGRSQANAIFSRDKKDIDRSVPQVCAVDYSPIVYAPAEAKVGTKLLELENEIMDAFKNQKVKPDVLNRYDQYETYNGPAANSVHVDGVQQVNLKEMGRE